VIDEREGMGIIYVVFMTAVILALVIVFGIRSRYAANPVRRGRHDDAQSSNQFVAGARAECPVERQKWTRPWNGGRGPLAKRCSGRFVGKCTR